MIMGTKVGLAAGAAKGRLLYYGTTSKNPTCHISDINGLARPTPESGRLSVKDGLRIKSVFGRRRGAMASAPGQPRPKPNRVFGVRRGFTRSVAFPTQGGTVLLPGRRRRMHANLCSGQPSHLLQLRFVRIEN